MLNHASTATTVYQENLSVTLTFSTQFYLKNLVGEMHNLSGFNKLFTKCLIQMFLESSVTMISCRKFLINDTIPAKTSSPIIITKARCSFMTDMCSFCSAITTTFITTSKVQGIWLYFVASSFSPHSLKTVKHYNLQAQIKVPYADALAFGRFLFRHSLKWMLKTNILYNASVCVW